MVQNFLRKYWIVILLAIIKFALPFALQHPLYELHRDELLYIEQGNHLAWGFMEVPPLLAVFAKITHWFGAGFFWVKFWPALFGALTLVLACGTARQLQGGAFAQFIAGCCLLLSAFLRVHILFQPNFLEIFFWTLSAWYLLRYVNTSSVKYLYFLAVALGLGWLSKYSVAFFIAGMLTGLLLTSHRKVFTSKHLYFAGLLAFIIILPNLSWQYTHNWPVIHHMKKLRETQLQFLSPLTFLKNQVLMHIACSFIWIGGLLWLLFSAGAGKYRLIAWLYLTVILLLTVTNGKDYYALGVYPTMFAAGGAWLEKATLQRVWLRYAAVVVMVLLFIPLVPILMPVWAPAKLAAYYKKIDLEKTGTLRWEDLQNHELPQDFADMLSWREMGEKVSRVYHNLPDSTRQRTLIYCRNYALAGAVTYYGKGLPQVTSDHASFLFWMPDKYAIRNLLFVGKRIPAADDEVFQQFEKYTVVDSITTPMAREKGVKIILYENGNGKVNAMIEAGIKEMKEVYSRK